MPSAKSLSSHGCRTYPTISRMKSTTFRSRSSWKNVIVGDMGIPCGSASTLSPVLLLGSTNSGSFRHLCSTVTVFYLCLVLLLRLGQLLTAKI